MEGNLKSQGWHLSEEGKALCQEQCKESKSDDFAKVALEMDLRSIGAPSLPAMGSKRRQQVAGPLILQIQKVKNVAVPSSKQNSQTSKRFLRVELTDGQKNISAMELEGPIGQLSVDTPPGTKIKIRREVEVANGFMLLTKSSVEILGGKVEGLLKKWHTTKAVPDNIGRVNEVKDGGPPQFVKFARSINSSGGKVSSDSTSRAASNRNTDTVQRPRQPSPSRETSTRAKMDLPSSYFESSKKKEGSLDESTKVSEHISSCVKALSLQSSKVIDIEDMAPSKSRLSDKVCGESGNRSLSKPGFVSGNQSRGHHSGGPTTFTEGERERRGRGRGRGRGRRRDLEDSDSEEYRQDKPRGWKLFDFIDAREQQGSEGQTPQGAQTKSVASSMLSNPMTSQFTVHGHPAEISASEPGGMQEVVANERISRGRGRGRGRERGRRRDPEDSDSEEYRQDKPRGRKLFDFIDARDQQGSEGQTPQGAQTKSVASSMFSNSMTVASQFTVHDHPAEISASEPGGMQEVVANERASRGRRRGRGRERDRGGRADNRNFNVGDYNYSRHSSSRDSYMVEKNNSSSGRDERKRELFTKGYSARQEGKHVGFAGIQSKGKDQNWPKPNTLSKGSRKSSSQDHDARDKLDRSGQRARSLGNSERSHRIEESGRVQYSGQDSKWKHENDTSWGDSWEIDGQKYHESERESYKDREDKLEEIDRTAVYNSTQGIVFTNQNAQLFPQNVHEAYGASLPASTQRATSSFSTTTADSSPWEHLDHQIRSSVPASAVRGKVNL